MSYRKKEDSYVNRRGSWLGKQARKCVFIAGITSAALFGYFSRIANAQEVKPKVNADISFIVEGFEKTYNKQNSKQREKEIEEVCKILYDEHTVTTDEMNFIIENVVKISKNKELNGRLIHMREQYKSIQERLAKIKAKKPKTFHQTEDLFKEYDISLEPLDAGKQFSKEMYNLAKKALLKAKEENNIFGIKEYTAIVSNLERLVKQVPENRTLKQRELMNDAIRIYQEGKKLIHSKKPEQRTEQELELVLSKYKESLLLYEKAEEIFPGAQFEAVKIDLTQQINTLNADLEALKKNETLEPRPKEPEKPAIEEPKPAESVVQPEETKPGNPAIEPTPEPKKPEPAEEPLPEPEKPAEPEMPAAETPKPEEPVFKTQQRRKLDEYYEKIAKDKEVNAYHLMGDMSDHTDIKLFEFIQDLEDSKEEKVLAREKIITYIETGIRIDSNKTTSAFSQHASFFSNELNFTGLYGYSEWMAVHAAMMNQIHDAGYLQLNPLAVTKAAELAGIKVPKSLAESINISASFDRNETRERIFQSERQIDAEFDVTTHTSTKTIIKEENYATFGAIKIFPWGIEGILHTSTQTTRTDNNSVVYNINLNDPSANYEYGLSQTLEQKIRETGIQLGIKYFFDTKLSEKSSVKGFVELLGDFTTIKHRTIEGKQIYGDSFVGIAGQVGLTEYLSFNFITKYGILNPPGNENDGWKDIDAFASAIVTSHRYKLRTSDFKLVDRIMAAFFATGHCKQSRFLGGGIGAVLGTGVINAKDISNITYRLGKDELGLTTDLGDAISEFEKDRLFRTLPLTLVKGTNAFFYAEIFQTENKEMQERLGVSAYFGMTCMKMAITAKYYRDTEKEQIGAYAHFDFEVFRLLIGFFREKNDFKKHDSHAGELAIEFPLG
ncbi:hypothetical protein JW851_04330 [Candidatus Woesearchaeota archaeon]|nr:hypothetical protein [Candidatus Woesearchaeota archaeon]